MKKASITNQMDAEKLEQSNLHGEKRCRYQSGAW